MLVCNGREWREGNVPMSVVAMSKSMSYAGGSIMGATGVMPTNGTPGAMMGAMMGAAPGASGSKGSICLKS
jgi:hypothetical protein